MSSLKPSEVEDILARSFGDFTPTQLETFVGQMLAFDVAKKNELLLLANKRRKPTWICKKCGNDREEEFDKDDRLAQITCKKCGIVAVERQVHDGEGIRRFEGEADPSMHGSVLDDKYSSSHNLQTRIVETISGTMTRKQQQVKELALAQASVELNLSSMMDPNKQGRTRIGFKDDFKEDIFARMEAICESSQLHRIILERAQTIFARYRDDTERLDHCNEIAAACMILSYRETLAENQQEFTCKYCQSPYSLMRDKDNHQKTCEYRPPKKLGSSCE